MWIVKNHYLLARTFNSPILPQTAKFREDGSNHSWAIAIFVTFKVATATILDFQIFDILTIGRL